MSNAVFTIVSRNYFAYARTLGDSLRASNPDVEYNILVVDRKDPAFEAQHAGWRITWVEDLGIPDFARVAFKYDILELNTNVKPTFAKRLLDRHDKVVYLDPDIFVYQSLAPVFELLDAHAVVLTPHITQPIDDDALPGEPEFMTSGIYNLGFAAFNASTEARKLLDWWERRCLHLAYNEQSQGFFVDQKWMDFAPSLCGSTFVLRDPQYNTAYWNLHERCVDRLDNTAHVAGRPLIFFHFSGLPPLGDDRISKYQTRYRLSQRPDVAPLFDAYRSRLAANGHEEYLKLPYGFGSFSNGAPISALARRVAAGWSAFASIADPFDATGSLFALLRDSRLLASADTAQPATAAPPTAAGAMQERRRIAGLVGACFRLLLRVLGPERYVRLMRFIASSTNLRSQHFLLRGDR
jgi:hypothetical protein